MAVAVVFVWERPISAGGADGTAQTRAAEPVAGLRAYVDPRTGELVAAPASRVPTAAEAFAMGIDVPAVAEPGPRGGVMVRLDPRFQGMAVATVDAEGRLDAECLSPAAADGDRAAP